jgi:hypothetical protein
MRLERCDLQMKRAIAIFFVFIWTSAAFAYQMSLVHRAAFFIGSTYASGGTGGDPTTGVLLPSNDAYANWQMAGLQSIGGIPNRTTQCGATLTPSGGDDTTQINNAIAACPDGDFVLLGPGTFETMEGEQITINKSVTLRGTGTCNNASAPYCQTVIEDVNGIKLYTTGNQCSNTPTGPSYGTCTNQATVFMGPGEYESRWANCSFSTPCSGTTTLAADAAKGSRTIQVAQTSAFATALASSPTNLWVLIDEASAGGYLTDPSSPTSLGQVWASSDSFSSTSTTATARVIWQKHNPAATGDDFSSGQTPATSGSAGCWYSYCDRPTAEIHRVTAIGAGPCPGVNCTLTFDSPLTVAFRQSGSHNAQVYLPTNLSGVYTPFVVEAGLENVTLERFTNGDVTFSFCAYCWVKNVESRWWIFGGFTNQYGVRDQIESSYSHDCADSDNNSGGGEYGFNFDFATTETLVENSISVTCGKPMTMRSVGGGNVFAYNVIDDSYYLAASVGNAWVETQSDAGHGIASHETLLEGNMGANVDTDDTHGSEFYQTFFRNWAAGFRQTFTDPSNGQTVNDEANLPGGNGPFRTAGPMEYNYWFGYVGNVLGTSGQTTAANGWVNQGFYGTNNAMIWFSGWLNWNGSNADSHLTAQTSADYIERHANYSYLTNSISYASGYSTTLPNSFFLTSAPAYFGASGSSCTYPWPWVTPQGGSQVLMASGSGCSSYYGLPAEARYQAGTPFVQP